MVMKSLSMPVYPRIPVLYDENFWAIRKKLYGSCGWCVLIRKNGCHVTTAKTKEDALEKVRQYVDYNNLSILKQREKWFETYGPLIAGKAEGIDYRFA